MVQKVKEWCAAGCLIAALGLVCIAGWLLKGEQDD